MLVAIPPTSVADTKLISGYGFRVSLRSFLETPQLGKGSTTRS